MAKQPPTVWISDCMISAKGVFIYLNFKDPDTFTAAERIAFDQKHDYGTFDESEEAYFSEKVGRSSEIKNLIWNAERLPEALLPDQGFFIERREQSTKIGKLMTIVNGYLMVHAEIAELLEAHNLGQTQLKQVDIFSYDGTRLMYEDYYFVNIAERRQLFSIEESEGYFKPRGSAGKVSVGEKHDVHAIDRAAADLEIDLWHDPLVSRSIFLSDRLYQAIKAAKLTRWFHLMPCRLF